MRFYEALAVAALVLHFFWLVWVVLGWVVTRRRPLLRWLHIGSLAYGVLVEALDWVCPLTVVENWALWRAGLRGYGDAFLLHYLDRIVYPDVPAAAVRWTAAVVCAALLGIYVNRYRRRTAEGW